MTAAFSYEQKMTLTAYELFLVIGMKRVQIRKFVLLNMLKCKKCAIY